ncbi:MAG: aspartyl protease family protein [Candidatus Odinarchaeota archaeon]
MVQMKIQLGEDSGHPHVPVMINGKGPFIFVLDTGASFTTISKFLADELGIETYEGEKREARGAGGGKLAIKMARLERIDIGTLSRRNEEVGVIDRNPAFGSGRGRGNGVIGYNTLRNYRVSIHYDLLQLKLEESNNTDLHDSPEWIPFTYLMDSHLLGIPVHINGQGPIDFILDTGSSGNIMTPTVARELGIPNELPENRLEATGCSGGECIGVGGRAMGYGVVVQSIKIGSAQQRDTMMGVIDLGVISPNGKKIDYGIIGYPFLKEYELIIDYPKKRIALVNHKAS